MMKTTSKSVKLLIATCMILAILGCLSFSNAMTPREKRLQQAQQQNQSQPQQKFSTKIEEMQVKSQAFASNARSFKSMIEDADLSSYEKSKDNIVSIIESMEDNCQILQTLTKTISSTQNDDDKKNFYLRDILPNLQNINRQLARIKADSKKSTPDLKNVKFQANRISESIQQVVDRINQNQND